jgi:CO dehydrogenase maturation factor
MKLAISGKGGAGKTLLSALLARQFALSGFKVTAIDADPDANLGLALGFNDAFQIKPIAEMKELIRERTETKEGETGLYFKINPRVDDIPEKYSLKSDGIRLLVMGRPKAGGAGCYCPENAVLSGLLAHLLLTKDEVVIVDMAAGIEHLNRGTARAVDNLIVVTEPTQASIDTSKRVIKLAKELGISKISIVGNKICSPEGEVYIADHLKEYNILGMLSFEDSVNRAEITGSSKTEASPVLKEAAYHIFKKLTSEIRRA